MSRKTLKENCRKRGTELSYRMAHVKDVNFTCSFYTWDYTMNPSILPVLYSKYTLIRKRYTFTLNNNGHEILLRALFQAPRTCVVY